MSNSKFISFYIPHSDNTINILYYLIDNHLDVLQAVDRTLDFNSKNILNTSASIQEILFFREQCTSFTKTMFLTLAGQLI